MIKIAIVEDEKIEWEKIQSFFKKIESETSYRYTLTFFENGNQFLFDFSYGLYDLVLMDIELSSDDNGIQVSEKLRKIDPDVFLVFMTNLAQYAIDGYKVDAIDYAMKPISYFDFKLRMTAVSKRIVDLHQEKIFIQADGKKIVVRIKDIYYIETISHSLVFHTSKGDFRTWSDTLKSIQKELEGLNFSMCNSCFLVNLEYVENIEGYTVTVKGKELGISHPRKKQFLKELSLFFGK